MLLKGPESAYIYNVSMNMMNERKPDIVSEYYALYTTG